MVTTMPLRKSFDVVSLVTAACVAWSIAARASAVAPPPAGGQVLDPCMYQPMQWTGVQLVSPAEGAPRDGLMFRTTLASAPGTSGLALPSIATIRVVVSLAADASAVAAGAVASPLADTSSFAWQPLEPLAAETDYEVHVVLVNAPTASCSPLAADVTQTFAITTAGELTPAPPEAPLRAIAYGLAWTALDTQCCAPIDTSPCGDAQVCAKCWSSLRQPTILPLWDAPLMAPVGDPLEYALYYGALTPPIEAGAVTGFGFGTALPDLPLTPESQLDAPFSPDQGEICMTAVTRNARTGAQTARVRCADVVNDARGLQGVALPNGVTLDAPGGAGLAIGPAACAGGALPQYDEPYLDVAASYHTSRDTCFPQCAPLFPATPISIGAGSGGARSVGGAGSTGTAGAGGAAANAGSAGTGGASTSFVDLSHDIVSPQSTHEDGGCQIGVLRANAAPRAWLWALALGVACAALRRRP
jgi:hypothetical protein